MDFYTGTVRNCCLKALTAATGPLTVAHIADQVGTTPWQARRALRQLETQGAAFRQPAAGGRYEWRAAR